MKIALLSDIHIDINETYPVLETLARMLREEGADGVILAGDASEDHEMTMSAMCSLEEESGCPVWYVPGNHDMWSLDFSKKSTDEIYAAYASDPRCLVGKKVDISGDKGPVCLVGDIGWYDYSFASSSFSLEELEKMSYGGRTWQDHIKNQWTGDNRGKMREMVEKLSRQLALCGETPTIVVTHMLPIREFCVPEDQEPWAYFNAFLGGAALGELYEQYPVRHAVCGHVHHRSQVRRHGILYHCPCLGYHTEWNWLQGPAYGHEEDLIWQLKHSIQWIEV